MEIFMTDNVSNVEALPQAETKSTEINKETTPEQDTKIFIPVKYNKQVMNLDIESASELAQKGMKFDSISKDYEKIKQMAMDCGKSVSEFVDELQINTVNKKKDELTEKCGGDTALAEHILKLESQNTDELRGLGELKEKFPEFQSIENIPETVLEKAKLRGSLLLDEYLRYKLEQEIAVNNSISKQQQAENASTGSQLGKKGNENPETAEFLKGLWRK